MIRRQQILTLEILPDDSELQPLQSIETRTVPV